jgi:hypothetical protein
MTSLKKNSTGAARTVYGSPGKSMSKTDLKSLNGSKSITKVNGEMAQSFNTRSSKGYIEKG